MKKYKGNFSIKSILRNLELHFAVLLFLFSIICFPGQARAVSIGLTPSLQNIGIGDTAMVDLNVFGLGNFAAPSLGAFSVEVLFDDSIVSFDSASYGGFLGDPSDFFETDVFTTAGPGLVSLSEISFLFDFELDALQPETFSLATLNFTGLAGGQSLLEFGFVDLSDAAFPANTIIPDLEGAAINVSQATPVSEPGSLFLFLSGMAGLFILKRWGKARAVT